MNRTIETKDAPKAIGPYSQAVIHDGKMIFLAGQIGLDPETGEFVEGGVAEQTERALLNIQAILGEGLSKMDRVLKVTIYLTDINDFATVNEVYSRFFDDKPPARSAVQAAGLPKGALVEIECIASAP